MIMIRFFKRNSLWIIICLCSLYSFYYLDKKSTTYLSTVYIPYCQLLSWFISPGAQLVLWSFMYISTRLKRHSVNFLCAEVLITQIICIGLARIVKNLVGRSRPELLVSKNIYGFYGFDTSTFYHSFPSGHTLSVFVLASALSVQFPHLKYLFFLLAILFSLTRVFLLKHFLSDILVSATVGILIHKFIHNYFKEIHYETIRTQN